MNSPPSPTSKPRAAGLLQRARRSGATVTTPSRPPAASPATGTRPPRRCSALSRARRSAAAGIAASPGPSVGASTVQAENVSRGTGERRSSPPSATQPSCHGMPPISSAPFGALTCRSRRVGERSTSSTFPLRPGDVRAARRLLAQRHQAGGKHRAREAGQGLDAMSAGTQPNRLATLELEEPAGEHVVGVAREPDTDRTPVDREQGSASVPGARISELRPVASVDAHLDYSRGELTKSGPRPGRSVRVTESWSAIVGGTRRTCFSRQPPAGRLGPHAPSRAR